MQTSNTALKFLIKESTDLLQKGNFFTAGSKISSHLHFQPTNLQILFIKIAKLFPVTSIKFINTDKQINTEHPHFKAFTKGFEEFKINLSHSIKIYDQYFFGSIFANQHFQQIQQTDYKSALQKILNDSLTHAK